MKKLKLALLSVLAVGLSSAALVGVVGAQAFSMTVPKGTTVDSSVYSAGKAVVIEGTVNGDVYCGGERIVIKGVVKGDVICAGRHVVLDGVIEGDARIAGQTVELKRSVAGSVTVAGSEVTMDSAATVGRDMTLTASNVTVKGSIGRDVVANGTTHLIDARIGRNLSFSGGQLSLQDKAVVGGSVFYQSKQNIEKADGAVVKGEVEHVESKKQQQQGLFGADSKTMFLAALVMFIFAMLLVLFAPQRIHRTSNFAVTSLGKTVLVGGLSVFVAPIAIVLFCTSVLALPVGLLLLFMMLTVLLVSGPIAGYYIGSMILAKSKNPIHIMAVGSAVMLVLYLLPIVGPVFMLVAYVIGAGAMLRTIRQAFPKPVYRVE